MQKRNFVDLAEIPEPVRKTAEMLAANAVHLATMLKERPYPGIPEAR